jgi:CRISPR-associated protein (TIGR02710 family)
MTKILFVTVGSSSDPIVTSINTLRPDRVIFVCSSGNHGSQSKLDEIITQCNLKDKFNLHEDLVFVDDPDRLFEVYKGIIHKVQGISTGDFLADYTGGTKTMSSALTLAALDLGMQLYVTTKDRNNTYKVEKGQRVKKVSVASLFVKRSVTQSLPPLIIQYNYSAICAQLEKLHTDFELSSDDDKYVENLSNFYKGLDLWDKFDHEGAYSYLEKFIRYDKTQPLILFLKQVIGSRVTFDDVFKSENGTKGHGYEIVQDLFLMLKDEPPWRDMMMR